MTKSLQKLIEVAFDVKVYFSVGSYEMHHYEDGSYCDFHVRQILDLKTLLRLANGLEVRIYANGDSVIVRLYEDFRG